MKIITLAGSARADGSNLKLLRALPATFPAHDFVEFSGKDLPLFYDGCAPNAVAREWQNAVKNVDALLICTPEYLHNLPALVKNALEWLTAGGELAGKKVIPVTLTPSAPRGEKAMQSLLWSLQALDAQILPSVALYREDVVYDAAGELGDCAGREILGAIFSSRH